MERKGLVITIFLIGIALLTSQAYAWQFANSNLRLKSVSLTSAGVEFEIKSKRNISPLSPCQNMFIVPNSHVDFTLMSAFLLTASAQKKKIGIVFDETSVECHVEVNSVEIY